MHCFAKLGKQANNIGTHQSSMGILINNLACVSGNDVAHPFSRCDFVRFCVDSFPFSHYPVVNFIADMAGRWSNIHMPGDKARTAF